MHLDAYGVNRCASCGYDRSTHDLGTLRCHPATGDKNGRRGTFKEPPPIDASDWRTIIERDAAKRRQAIEDARKPYEPEVIPLPLIPARSPHGPAEYAISNRGLSAVKLGRLALAKGWNIEPWYWMAHDRSEGCALRLALAPLRAVALWSRPATSAAGTAGWKAEYAYAWRTDIVGRIPTKLHISELEGLIHDEQY